MISARTETSRAETGSSSRRTRGSTARARAIPTRCRWPPDISWGSRCAKERCRPTMSRSADDPVVPTLGAATELVHDQDLLDRVARGAARVQRGVRILEDELDLPSLLPQGLASERSQVDPVEHDAPARRLLQPHQESRQSRLAAPGLPDDAQGLACLDFERDAIDRVDDEVGAADRIPLVEVDGLEDHRVAGLSPVTANSSTGTQHATRPSRRGSSSGRVRQTSRACHASGPERAALDGLAGQGWAARDHGEGWPAVVGRVGQGLRAAAWCTDAGAHGRSGRPGRPRRRSRRT